MWGGVLLSLQRGQRHSAASCSLPPGLDLRGRRASGVGPPAARKGPAGPGRAGQQCAPGGGNGGAGMGRGAVPAGTFLNNVRSGSHKHTVDFLSVHTT